MDISDILEYIVMSAYYSKAIFILLAVWFVIDIAIKCMKKFDG